MTGTPDPVDALSVARSLDATVRARADEIEAARQLPADLSRELAARGVYRWWVPEAYGGLEVPMAPALRAIEELARETDDDVTATLLGSFTGGTPRVREAILAAVFSRRDRLPVVVDAIEYGSLPASALSAVQRKSLLEHADAELRVRSGVEPGPELNRQAGALHHRKIAIDRQSWAPAGRQSDCAAGAGRVKAVFTDCLPSFLSRD